MRFFASLSAASPAGYSLLAQTAFLSGHVDVLRTKAAILSTVLKGKREVECRAMGQRFVPAIESLLRPEALRCLEWHRSEGHRLVLLTASLLPCVEPWAEKTGFHTVIATLPEIKSGILTGRRQ